MNGFSHTALTFRVFLLTLVFASSSFAYQRYSDGCKNCHEPFSNSFSAIPNNTWPSGKHNIHLNDMVDMVCDACHSTGDGWSPFLDRSNGTDNLPGAGCSGCHGRYYGPVAGYRSVGLRLHHKNAGITICGSCHDDPGVLQEMVMAPYYGKPTVNITEPCNGDGSENWTSDGRGLDNDGDLNYDGNNSDCIGPPHYWEPAQSLW